MPTPPGRCPEDDRLPPTEAVPLDGGDAHSPTVVRPGAGGGREATVAVPAEAAQAGASARFGKFIRTERLGAGGMGEVWKAWDTGLSRWVALKFMREQEASEIERFRREARLAGKLNHPFIASIYDVGCDQDRHFIAMQFVDGRTLLDFPRTDRPLLVRLVRDAAQAVDHAHAQGIIHRDLKPANLMATTRARGLSDRTSEHHLYVMDFGLARAQRGPDMSVSGGIVGTPAYMSPEQATGARAGPGADVYALGATLYELLTGLPPVVAKTPLETLRLVKEGEVRPPRVLDASVDADLDTIVMKCLEKDPRARYRSARDLAADLTRWLGGEAIAARAPSMAYRLRKALSRRRGLVAALALGSLAVGISVGILAPMAVREAARKAHAERTLALWASVSGTLADAEFDARAGAVDRQRQKLDAGLRACREALRHDDLPEAHYFLGRLLRARGLPGEAMTELDRAIELSPALGEARIERGLLGIELYARELEKLEGRLPGEALPPGWSDRKETDNPDLARLRRRATEDLSAAVRGSSWFREVDAVHGRAELERVRGEYDRARAMLEGILREEPAHVRALLSLARLASDQGKDDEALAHASRAIAIHASLAEAYVVRARAFSWKRELSPRDPKAEEWAEREFADAEQALALGIESLETLTWRGDHLLAQDRPDAAIRDYDAALRLNLRYGFAYRGRGLARLALGDDERALADLDTAVHFLPGLAHLHQQRAALHRRRGNLILYLADLDRSLEIVPDDPAVLRLRGEALLRRGQAGDALWAANDFTRALARNPSDPESLLGRALARESEDKRLLALQDCEDALKLAPPGWPRRAEAEAMRKRLRP
ncbi:MAG: protein kinase [Planctomycetes bacterium]|nr:protein kinase [Planctomycetota bacterium]